MNNTAANAVPIQMGLADSPFQPRLEAYSYTHSWADWAGYKTANTLRDVEMEYFAIRNQATLYDISPMYKYRFAGPEAESALNKIAIRDVSKIKTGRVGYAVWCDEDGMVIDDGTIFRFDQNEFMLLCQESMLNWLMESAWGFDVEVTDEQHNYCGLALQGPTSFAVLQRAGLEQVADMKPFDLREIEPGRWVSRTGYTAELGYELHTAPENALTLWDRLWQSGQDFGLQPIGGEALDIARIEAGFLAPGTDFQPIHGTTRLDRGRTPFELGLGRMVDFNKGYFNGRRALIEHQRKGPGYNFVKLDIAGNQSAEGAYIYFGKNKEVGIVRSAAWSPTVKKNLAFADLIAPYGTKIKEGLWADIYVDREGRWERYGAKASVVEGPFIALERAKQTPPLLY